MSNGIQLSVLIIGELKNLGIKYKEKKVKTVQSKSCSQRLFRCPLHLLPLTDAFLANGSVVQVPKFIADACSSILEHVEVEGLFRKAGSAIKQRELRKRLEAGLPLDKSHRVIDIANTVSYFVRELPEPFIPTHTHETLLQCLTLGENCMRAMLLVLLLMPPVTTNTVAYFMQFLRTVSVHSHSNKMSAENLAIVLAPGMMPYHDIKSPRFKNHIKTIKLLIENANDIGRIPASIHDKILIKNTYSSSRRPMVCAQTSSTPAHISTNTETGETQKKKKRRSEMFNGLRKIVGSAIGSLENLDKDGSFNSKRVPSQELQLQQQQQRCGKQGTPSIIRSSKKRKCAEQVSAFSAKKRKDLLALLPSNEGYLANTPQTKEPKKSRISLGGNRQAKLSGQNPIVATMERRWSLVSNGWSKPKKKIQTTLKTVAQNNFICNQEDNLHTNLSTEIPNGDEKCSIRKKFNDSSESESIRVSKDEYENIKERVAAIELQLSQDLENTQKTILKKKVNFIAQNLPAIELGTGNKLCDLEMVQNQYERVLLDTETLNSPGTEKLAQRLGRDLKIRRSIDQRVIRSPCERKIGTMRRRSQDKETRLFRTHTWHISSKSENMQQLPQSAATESCPNSFYNEKNLNRGRQNAISLECETPFIEQSEFDIESVEVVKTDMMAFDQSEQWTPAETFFSNETNNRNMQKFQLDGLTESETEPSTPQINDLKINTPSAKKLNANRIENSCTPMLPPKSLPRKAVNARTPNALNRLPFTSLLVASTPFDTDEINGRASIARLRTQNAGMVLEKAKLFDGLVTNSAVETTTTPKSFVLSPVRKTNNYRHYKMQLLNTPNSSKNKSLNEVISRKQRSVQANNSIHPRKILINEIINDISIVETMNEQSMTVLQNQSRAAKTVRESKINCGKPSNSRFSQTSLNTNSPRKRHLGPVNSSRIHSSLKPSIPTHRSSPRINKSILKRNY